MKFWLFILFLLITTQVQADPVIYQWTDERGVAHYSDIPEGPNVSVVLLQPQPQIQQQKVHESN